jgi:large subunit ribosomal protein L10
MARPEKIAQVEAVEASIKEARSIVLSDITGLNVAKVTELRRRCRAEGVDLKVVKNTLAKRGVKNTVAAGLEKYFEGPTAIAISRESENGAAGVGQVCEENELPKLKAGLRGRIDAKGVPRCRSPSKGELVSQLMGGIQVPRATSCRFQGPARNPRACWKPFQRSNHGEALPRCSVPH